MLHFSRFIHLCSIFGGAQAKNATYFPGLFICVAFLEEVKQKMLHIFPVYSSV